MRLIEQNDTVTLVNGEGSPKRQLMVKTLFVGTITAVVAIAHLRAAAHGWAFGWLVLLFVPAIVAWLVGEWRRSHHATLEIDRRFGRVRIERRFARRTVEESAALSDLSGLAIDTAKDYDGDATFTPVVTFKNGRRVLLGPPSSDSAMLQQAVVSVGRL